MGDTTEWNSTGPRPERRSLACSEPVRRTSLDRQPHGDEHHGHPGEHGLGGPGVTLKEPVLVFKGVLCGGENIVQESSRLPRFSLRLNPEPEVSPPWHSRPEDDRGDGAGAPPTGRGAFPGYPPEKTATPPWHQG